MGIQEGKGSYLEGAFVGKRGDGFQSYNPALRYEPVFQTYTDLSQVEIALEAANKAFRKWWMLSQEERNSYLLRLQSVFDKRQTVIATAISLEMGKPYWESLQEAKNLGARIGLMLKHGLERVSTEYPEGVPGETRYHAQGVLVVIGPYNFPAHLMNAHIIPALLTGNVVVVKPSEVCPWVGELYAECVHEAGLPKGVFNMLQGRGDVGRALVTHPSSQGVLFTGSYQTGRAISELLLDQPHKIAALEMGGKNFSVVLRDADLKQALIEVVQGAFLTTGQRCTATSRLLLEKPIADQFISELLQVTRHLFPSDPFDPQTLLGPLASRPAKERYLAQIQEAAQQGYEVLLPPCSLEQGAFVTPSLHLSSGEKRGGEDYRTQELFGPDICIEVIEDVEGAAERINRSPYGLSNAVFTKEKAHFEHLYFSTRAGVLNWNRSTNGASGQLPFGGVGKSGNQRAAGIDAVRYTTYPVAVNHAAFGERKPVEQLVPYLETGGECKALPSLPFSWVQIRPLELEEWPQYEKEIQALEHSTYEAGRQDSMSYLQDWLRQPYGLALILLGKKATGEEELLGYAIGGPLEESNVDGPLQDPMRGKYNTFYSTNVLLSSKVRGMGWGRRLKEEQLLYLRTLKNKDGSPRYLYVTGRNRVGYTEEITRINQKLGAVTVAVYDGQYGTPNGQALYYRISLEKKET